MLVDQVMSHRAVVKAMSWIPDSSASQAEQRRDAGDPEFGARLRHAERLLLGPFEGAAAQILVSLTTEVLAKRLSSPTRGNLSQRLKLAQALLTTAGRSESGIARGLYARASLVAFHLYRDADDQLQRTHFQMSEVLGARTASNWTRQRTTLKNRAEALRHILAEALVVRATCVLADRTARSADDKKAAPGLDDLPLERDPALEDPEAVLELAKELRRRSFPINLARRLLMRWFLRSATGQIGLPEWARQRPDHDRLLTEIRAELAVVTALATDLPADYRIQKAWDVLTQNQRKLDADEHELIRHCAGFIWKLNWQRTRNKSHLERALVHYMMALKQERARGNTARARNRRLSTTAEVIHVLECLADISDEFGRQAKREVQAIEDEDLRSMLGLPLTPSDQQPPEHPSGAAPVGRTTYEIPLEQVAKQLRHRALRIRDRTLQEWSEETQKWTHGAALHRFVNQRLEQNDTLFPQEQFRRLINLAELHFPFHDSTLPEASVPGLSLPRMAEEEQHRPPAEHWLDAKRMLKLAHELLPYVPGWLYERSVRELIDRLRDRVAHAGEFPTIAKETVGQFLGEDSHVLETDGYAKFGIALSGGGFRASLYHLGVLAGLAELDLLRHVEVLSCVSGGAVVGAHYYLKLGQLLENRADGELKGPEPYVSLVKELIDEFYGGVQQNIRTRVLANPWANLRMANPLGAYSRTDRAGELFERYLYGPVRNKSKTRKRDARGKGPWKLTDLCIIPKGDFAGFRPTRHNWRRKNKVPMLILNATTLNTGHNWQFTGTWMGESPAAVDSQVDANYRLRRLYLGGEAPGRHSETTLGKAVAASACVPGLFDPTTLKKLYGRDKHRVVRLVDGGVFDNQGVASLLEQDCRTIVVSDASGQMDNEDFPSNSPLSVPLRSNAILMDRVRQAQYRDLVARRDTGLLTHFAHVHLKKDLQGEAVDWIGCYDPKSSETVKGGVTGYGIRNEVQAYLSGIRTDLDSFCDAEAYALMYSGYKMIMSEAGRVFPSAHAAHTSETRQTRWPFLDVEPFMSDTEADTNAPPIRASASQRFKDILDVGRQRLFKIERLWGHALLRKAKNALGEPWTRRLLGVGALFSVVALIALGYWLYELRLGNRLIGTLVSTEVGSQGISLDTLRISGNTALNAVIALLLLSPLLVFTIPFLPRIIGSLLRTAQMVVLGTVGWAAVWVHLLFFDRFYKRWGKLSSLVS